MGNFLIRAIGIVLGAKSSGIEIENDAIGKCGYGFRNKHMVSINIVRLSA